MNGIYIDIYSMLNHGAWMMEFVLMIKVMFISSSSSVTPVTVLSFSRLERGLKEDASNKESGHFGIMHH